MATGALVSEQEYLNTTYKPACDYIDGILHQKPMPTLRHSAIQGQLIVLINPRYPQFLAGPELTVKIRTAKYFVPDVVVQRRDTLQEPYPSEPVHLCVEILSPEDRLSETLAECEEYHAWGVETTWIIDPEARCAWEFGRGHRLTEIQAGGSLTAGEISVAIRDLFSVL